MIVDDDNVWEAYIKVLFFLFSKVARLKGFIPFHFALSTPEYGEQVCTHTYPFLQLSQRI